MKDASTQAHVYTCAYCKATIDGVMMGAGDGTSSPQDQRFAHPDCYWRAEYQRVVQTVKDAESAHNAAIEACIAIVSTIGQHNLVYDCWGRTVYQHYKMVAEMRKLVVTRKEG